VAVLNDYPAAPVDGGVRLALGDAYAGERRRVVLSLHLPHLATLGALCVADLVLRYVAVGERIAEHTLTVPVAVNLVAADETAAAQPDLEVREEVLVLAAAQARREAIRLADKGDLAGAAELLSAQASTLRLAQDAMPSSASLLAMEADALAEAVAVAARYDASSRKRLHDEAQQRQRRPRAAP
jgi:Ca-activated chloride channel family protein